VATTSCGATPSASVNGHRPTPGPRLPRHPPTPRRLTPGDSRFRMRSQVQVQPGPPTIPPAHGHLGQSSTLPLPARPTGSCQPCATTSGGRVLCESGSCFPVTSSRRRAAPMVARRRGRPVAAARSPRAFAVCPGWSAFLVSVCRSVLGTGRGSGLGDGRHVQATEVVAGQHRAGTSRNARSAWPARTAPRAGEYQRAWVAACWKQSGDGLSDLAGKRDLTDAGGALWTLESAAVLAACLVAGIDHLEDATVVPSVPADTLA
jgi:hypothetical protein